MSLNNIKKENLNEEQLDIFSDALKAKDIEILSQQDGGKAIMKALRDDSISLILRISADTKTLEEYIQLSAKLNVLLGLYRTFTGAKTNREALEEMLADSFVG